MMRNSFNLFVMYHWILKKKSYSGKTFRISFLGIAVGTMALVVILSVMNGFQLTFINAILNYDSYHLRINEAVDLTTEASDNLREIKLLFHFSEQNTLLLLKNSPPVPVKVKYITFETAIQLRLIETETDQMSLGSGISAILGSELMRKANRSSSQAIQLLDFSVSDEDGFEPNIENYNIITTFSSGHLDIDQSFIFIIVDEAKLRAKKNVQTGIILHNKYACEEVGKEIRKILGNDSTISTWREYNKSFFNALQLEKNMMILLVSIVYLVVAINIYYGMRRVIVEKYNDIALLKAVGLTGTRMCAIIIFIGFLIGCSGAITGLLGGIFLSAKINYIIQAFNTLIDYISNPNMSGGYQVLSKNSFYLVNIPHTILFQDLAITALLAISFSVLSSWYASSRIALLRPSEVLRHE